jgi:hypothetical protein
MFIEDLSTNAYFAIGDNVRAVGWLEAEYPYARGAVPPEFLARLKEHVATAYQPVYFMGVHECSLCPEGKEAVGASNVMIPTERLIYIAPELVVHYIEDHGYRPPQEFIDAVMICPDQESPAFHARLARLEKTWDD